MALERRRPGDPLAIRARDWSTLDRVTEIVQGDQAWQTGEGPASAQSLAVLRIHNGSGANVDRHGVLGIDSVLITPGENADAFAYQPALVGVTPSRPAHVGRYGILLEPIRDGEVGRCCLLGCLAVKIQVNAESDTHAEILDGDSGKLASGKYGSARILWKDAGTGEKWAVVKIGHDPGASLRPFTFTGDMGESPLASNQANVSWDDAAGGTGVVTDRYTEWANAEAGHNGHASWIDGRMEIIGVKQCEAAT